MQDQKLGTITAPTPGAKNLRNTWQQPNYIISEYSERNTFNNTRGASNIDLTITDNLLKYVLDWEISDEENLADQLYKIPTKHEKRNNNFNTAKYSNAKFVVREDKLHLFDNMFLQEIQKYDIVTKNIVDAGAVDSYISNEIAKRVDIEQNIERI